MKPLAKLTIDRQRLYRKSCADGNGEGEEDYDEFDMFSGADFEHGEFILNHGVEQKQPCRGYIIIVYCTK